MRREVERENDTFDVFFNWFNSFCRFYVLGGDEG
jgi:hypothetical protein